MHAIDRHVNSRFIMVRLERIAWRMQCCAHGFKEQRTMKMPNLQGVGPALAKLQSGIEADAKKFLEEVEAATAKQQTTFATARRHIDDAHQGLAEINAMLNDLDKATNGGPTLGDSSPSPVDARPVDAMPGETAGLPHKTGA